MTHAIPMVDWPQIMRELKAAGWSYRAIQAEIGVHKDRCAGIVKGEEPSYSQGIALLALHSDRNKPREEKVESVAHFRQACMIQSANVEAHMTQEQIQQSIERAAAEQDAAFYEEP